MTAKTIKPKAKHYLTSKQSDRLVFWAFLFPSLFAFTLMVIIPFFMGIFYSFTDFTGLNRETMQIVNFDNYIGIFSDIQFIYSFIRTVIYSVLNIALINLVAFTLALFVTKELKLQNLYRAGFFLPNLIGGLVLGYIWNFIYNNALIALGETEVIQFVSGVINNDIFARSVLIDGDSALIALVVVVAWQYAGYIMMIYVAALQNVPLDLIEASKIDGAGPFQRLKNITFPLVAQAFTVSLFLTLVTSFKQFDTVMSLTKGGPATLLDPFLSQILGVQGIYPVQSTYLVAINIYQEAFSYNQMGYGQAKAIVFFLVLMVISLLQVYFSKKREVEY